MKIHFNLQQLQGKSRLKMHIKNLHINISNIDKNNLKNQTVQLDLPEWGGSRGTLVARHCSHSTADNGWKLNNGG